MSETARPRRSALYMPASNPKAVAKARALPADVIILDLEDAVAPEMKADARNAAIAAVREGGFGSREVVIRVNALDTPWGEEDMKAVSTVAPDAVLVPKVSSDTDIHAYDRLLSQADPRTRLWTMIETCASVPFLHTIAACASTTRLSLFVMGTNDLAKEMRARILPGREAFLPILVQALVAARAHGVAILDGVCNEFKDLGVFSEEAQQGADLGFDGKTLIHPDQIDPCNAIYSPSPEELEWAGAVIAAFALPENAGKGAIRVNGKMAELLHLDQAQRLQAIAEKIWQSALAN